jgi:3-oxoacyl-[acyl-carrier protein] reductase
MNISLNGKTAVVCGCTGGIGKAIATQFALSGASLILVARNQDKLSELADSLPGTHKTYVADFANTDEVAEVAAKIAAENIVHILVNNTGGPPAGPAHKASAAEYLAAFNLHLINNHNMVQACIPSMQTAGYGRIINVISTSVKIPLANLGVSNTIRGAVGNWSKTLANELGPMGITVNNILPGATATERLSSIISGKSGKTGKSIAEVEKEMLAEIPAARFGQPEEPGYAACFLASEYAAYINGTNVVVDGGRTGNL